jgi:hypothetical protein
MSNRTEARSAKAARMHATGRLPLLRLFSTPLPTPTGGGPGRPQGVVVGVITLKTASTFVIWHADPDVPKSHLKLDSNMWHLLYGGSTDPPPSPLFAQARLRRDLFGSS